MLSQQLENRSSMVHPHQKQQQHQHHNHHRHQRRNNGNNNHGMKRDGDSDQKYDAPFSIKRRRTNTNNNNNSYHHNRRGGAHCSSSYSNRRNDTNQKRNVTNPVHKESFLSANVTTANINIVKPPVVVATPAPSNPWEYRTQPGTTHDEDDNATKNSTETIKTNIGDLPQLDTSNSDHCHKIQKRRKMISYGKNTVGYDEYLKQVPKPRRKPRCPAHPTTPDATRDIPWKRFHGLVKAWRKSLHMYDPQDLLPDKVSTNTVADSSTKPEKQDRDSSVPQSRQETEIRHAAQRGLQVDFNNSSTTTSNAPSSPSSMAGELDRLEIEKEEIQINPRFAWYQSSDDDDKDMNMEDDDADDSDDELL